MSTFPVNPERFDAYKNSRFLLYFDTSTTPVPMVSSISGLVRNTEVIVEREGGLENYSLLSPGVSSFEPIVVTRGLSQDTTFEDWANAVLVFDNGAPSMSLKNLRKELRIVLLNEEGQAVMAFKLHRCWPSRYEPLCPLNASSPTTMNESLTIQYESFERDASVTEPVET